MATNEHAPRVFFYVAALVRSFFARWMLCYRSSQSMVAQAGLTSVRPVPKVAGISTPVWATTHKRGNFGGSGNPLTLRLPPWLRPSPRLTLHSASCLRPCAVLR
ncbi:ash family protein [Serratia nevei]|uniref:ash family protein n=1 Tax=Serratia nevei TaxID=2703794 RepID=UPI0027D2F869|nr:ash family protein [Serratia nevei]WMC76066.1 ash family protein [Serratia nevei]